MVVVDWYVVFDVVVQLGQVVGQVFGMQGGVYCCYVVVDVYVDSSGDDCVVCWDY